jgi:carbohydrate-selective porin OprB
LYLLVSPTDCTYAQDAQAPAEAASPASDKSEVSPLISVPRQALRLLGERGLSFQTQLVNDWSKNLASGFDPDYGFGRYSFDFFVTLDSEKSLGWKGGTGLVRLKQHIREFGWNDDGASQVLSNIDASSRTTLYELWFEQKLFAGKVRLKGGKIDANSEFAVVENGTDFLNSSMGYSPTIMAFPTYPEPQPGAGIFLTSAHSYGVGLGVFRSSMGTMSIAEPRLRWSLGENELPGHIRAGYWRVDGAMKCFDGNFSTVSQGFYTVIEQGLWRSSDSGRDQTFTSFLQFGRASGDVSLFTEHVGGGGVWQAPLGSRPHDGLGFAATWVRFSSQPAAGFDYGGELIAEGYYKLAVNHHISLLPDLQYLHHPGGLRANPDVVVFTPRLVVSF